MAQAREGTRADAQILDYFREQVATSCRILAQHGLVTGSTGHVSRRVPDTDDILVRGRPHVDKGLRFAEPSSIIRVGPDARPVGDTHGVSRVREIYLHTEVYKRRPNVNAVIHAHPPGALLCTINNVPLRPIFGGFAPQSMRMAEAGVPLYERSITLHTLEETIPMLDVMGDKDVILLSRHGVLVTGRSVEEATSRAIAFESLARLNWLAALHGDPGEILDVDKEEFARRVREEPRARGDGGDGEGGGWANLTALLESGATQYDDVGLGFRF
jgi:ribulose-5-phosphate 4-epimerase/fuculose-1-phosphate aldolase